MKNESKQYIELISVAAVVMSLLFVGYEINQNTRATRAQIHQARQDNYVSNQFSFMSSDYFAPLAAKMGGVSNLEGLKKLNPEERIRVSAYHRAVVGDMENMYFQLEEGYLDEDFWIYRIAPTIKRMYPIWKELGIIGDNRPGFAAEVERIVNSPLD